MARKRIRTAEEFLAQDPEERRQETRRLLAERIVHGERVAEEARARREGRPPDPRKLRTAEEFLAQDPREREAETMRILAERIAYHERKLEEERAAGERAEQPET